MAALLLAGLCLGWVFLHDQKPAAMAWTRPDAFRPAVNHQEFLTRLADLAGDWFKEQPATPQQLASRITEFRRGCDRLQSHASVIPEQDRKWLLEACQKWSDKLGAQFVEVERFKAHQSDRTFEQIRTDTDAIIETLIKRLEKEAKA